MSDHATPEGSLNVLWEAYARMTLGGALDAAQLQRERDAFYAGVAALLSGLDAAVRWDAKAFNLLLGCIRSELAAHFAERRQHDARGSARPTTTH